ncbi:hypothetical protein HPT29_023530 [Microvirga terrae]|uniref:Uncharacterized protein n=1 Tax=Microvirga terrae TaxID=2740529 RepID=A0ABY5RQT3_9HYPH|nr:hypothetical protein [Microvirga terrae]UVF19358.1 hypothetical protein HPT29_023530 [Microvirga terrae]
MLPPDKGTRNLLPLLADKQDGIVQAAEDEGSPVRPASDPGLSASHSSNPTSDPAPSRIEPAHQPATSPFGTDLAPAVHDSASHAFSSPGPKGSTDGISGHARSGVEIDDNGTESGQSSVFGSSVGSPTAAPHAAAGASSGASHRMPEEAATDEGQKDPGPALESGGVHTPLPETAAGTATVPGAGLPSDPPTPAGIPIAVPDSDDIHIVQTAFVDQDADVLLNGWMGESKIRVFMDNDADMEQDADIRLDVDANNRVFLRLDQSMTIDQNTEIDLDIYEVKGVLYVDLYLKNEVDIVQDTELDLMMDGWHGKSQFVVNNHLDIRQDVDVDVDIDDELEEKFAIKVAIGVKQAIDVDQDADIDVSYADGAIGVDVDAVQTATIDQDTTLRIDFSVV